MSDHIDMTSPDAIALRRAQLLAERKAQEEALKKSGREVVTSLHPVNLVKESLHDLAQDKVVRTDIAKVGLSVGANFLISQLLGQPDTSKKALRNALVETIATTLINNNAPKIIDQVVGILKMVEQQSVNSTPNKESQ